MARAVPETTLFGVRLPAAVERFLGDTNPWWRGKPMRPFPWLPCFC